MPYPHRNYPRSRWLSLEVPNHHPVGGSGDRSLNRLSSGFHSEQSQRPSKLQFGCPIHARAEKRSVGRMETESNTLAHTPNMYIYNPWSIACDRWPRGATPCPPWNRRI